MFEMSVHYDWQETRKLALEEGIEKGIEKGETKALVKTVMKLLTKKFGVLPADYREKIGQLDVITLEMIIDEIWDCDNLVTIEKYFI